MVLPRFAAIGVVLILAGSACTGGTADPASGAGSSPATNAARVPLLPETVDELPDMEPAGFRELLDQLAASGTPVVVNVWGSWCGPCRTEAPFLARAARTYGNRVQFLGVDILDDRDGARAFIREFDWSYPSVFDPSGSIRDALGSVGQPVTIFFDRDGREVSRWTGPLPPGGLEARIGRLLA